MKNGGVAILGKAEVEGENRAQRAIEEALNSPLLNDNDIKGAKWILLNINSAEGDYECTMDELETINNYLRERTGEHSDVIMGMGYDTTLGQKLGITLIATGFEGKDPFMKETPKKAEAPIEEKIVMTLVSDEMLNDASNKITAATEPVVEKIEAPEMSDSYFTLGDVPEMHLVDEINEAEENFELDEISGKEYEAEVDAEISIAAMSRMEEMTIHEVPVVALVEETMEEEMVEEEMEEMMEVEAIAEVAELSPEVVLFELAPEAISNPSDFILNKPINIYATDEIEEDLEEEVVFEEAPLEEMEEEEMVEEEELVEEEEMELSFATITPTEVEAPAEVVMESAPLVEMIQEEVMEAPKAPVVEYQSSFGMQDEPAMQLVMRDENNHQPARPVHPSSLEMPLDNAEEQRRKVAERIQKLRNLSFNINNGPDPNTEFDAVPAYVRRNLDLFGNTLASVENYYSKYTVEKDENNQTQISTINTFLDGKKPD